MITFEVANEEILRVIIFHISVFGVIAMMQYNFENSFLRNVDRLYGYDCTHYLNSSASLSPGKHDQAHECTRLR